VGIILIAVGIAALSVLAYTLFTRDNPREVAVEAERERVADEAGLRNHIDFEADLRPPREPGT
jgi:hypothetical protein